MRPYRILTDETIIGMPPGIGDLHWIMTKLESFKRKNNIKKIRVYMNLGREENGSFHDCSLEYLDLIPFIDAAESIVAEIPFEYSFNGGSGTPLFENRKGLRYIIEFNSKLENHTKLKDILPEYEINYDYPIYKPPKAKEFAETFKREMGGKFALLFTASLKGNEAWVRELWTPKDWVELAKKMLSETGCRPVLIGAKWDSDYAEKIYELDKEFTIHDLVGKTSVAQLFALIREANVVISWQCGVGIMATQFRTPVVAFWPIEGKKNPQGKFNRDFMRTWLPPWANESGYIPYGWGDESATPDGIFADIKEYL